MTYTDDDLRNLSEGDVSTDIRELAKAMLDERLVVRSDETIDAVCACLVEDWRYLSDAHKEFDRAEVREILAEAITGSAK